MKTVSCLIIEPSDLTRAGALKPAVFQAFATHPVVINGALNTILKNQPAPAPVKVRRSRASSTSPSSQTPEATPEPREAPTP